jgi:hypothetical protein
MNESPRRGKSDFCDMKINRKRMSENLMEPLE